MFATAGHRFAPAASRRDAARFEADGTRCRLLVDEQVVSEAELDALDIEPAIGSTARRIRWPDGTLFETTDLVSFDAWARSRRGARIGLHRFERNLVVAIGCLVLTVASVLAGYRFGLPWLFERGAERAPPALVERFSEETLGVIDRSFAAPTELPLETQRALRERFDAMLDALPPDEFDYRLHLRDMGGMPNAFALPGGDVIVTDAFVELVQDPDEFDAVLLHEIGHVRARHGLRNALQASAVSVVVSLAMGDATGVGGLVTGVPLLLAQSGYSREAELEADEFAFQAMLAKGRDPAAFARVIRRLEAAYGGGDGGGRVVGDGADGDVSTGPSLLDYFSTHPAAEARARHAEELSRQNEVVEP